jgi:hypothetical protein
MANQIDIKHLEYELRQLLGATKVCSVLEKHHTGNIVNYVEDSVYVHVRNLYNFFAANAQYDAKVTEFTAHTFQLPLYDTWKQPLHVHALHIKVDRTGPSSRKSNVQNGKHINEMIQDFASDIERLWIEWIRVTTDARLKAQLVQALENAQTESQDDATSLESKLSS